MVILASASRWPEKCVRRARRSRLSLHPEDGGAPIALEAAGPGIG